MNTISAVFERGFIKPLGDTKIREKEKVLLAVIKLQDKAVTEETYGAMKLKKHSDIEQIIEETEYESE